MNELFVGTPTGLELLESLIIRFCSAKAETFKPLVAEPSDTFPHGEVISPEVLEFHVRGPVFVDRLIPKMKKNPSGNILAIVGS